MAGIKQALKKNRQLARLAKKRVELREAHEKKLRMRQTKADPLKANILREGIKKSFIC